MTTLSSDTLRWATHHRRSSASVYALSIAALGAAVLVRVLLDPVLGNALPFVTLFGAVAAAVWLGGIRPAIVVTLLGYLSSWYLFVEPRGLLPFPTLGISVGMVAYLVTSTVIIVFGEALRRSQQQVSEQLGMLAVTLASIGDAVITTDLDGRVTSLNAVAEAITGWSGTDAEGLPLETVFTIINEDTRQAVENPVTRSLREGRIIGLANHTVLLRKDGGECPIDDSASPIRDERGQVCGCVLVFRDVTAQRRQERERASQLLMSWLLASIVESSDDAIISKSLDGVIQSWNTAAERLFGYSAAEAIGRHISLVIPPDRQEEENHILFNLKAGVRIDHFETERVRSNGERFMVSLTISPVRDSAGHIVGASKIVRDITDRKRAEAEREKFVTLIESSSDFIAMCDLDGRPFFVNRAGLDMVGLDSVEDARQAPVGSFFFPEDQRTIIDEFFPRVLEQGRGETEVRFRHFKTGAARWMSYKLQTLPDAQGRPIGFATVSQDMSERRRLEDNLRQLAANLSEADHRKNEFLAMLAHELRNPLAPISNAARALRLGGGDGNAVQAAAEMLERQVGQMSRLIDDLLDVSRITQGRIELRLERIELNTIIAHAVDAVSASYRSMGHELIVTLPPDAIYLRADPTRVAQIVGNLLVNACKFTDRGGRIWLAVAIEDGHAVVRVRDNGIGIEAHHLPTLFDMFAQVDTSLERSRDGLGIGLTLVKTLSELHGGDAEAHSDGPGLGSEFIVRLPVTPDVPAPEKEPEATGVPAVAPRRVLIVDDNQDGAESLAMLLQLSGHETRIAHDGREAIVAAESMRPDAMLLDIGLPQLNGYEVSRHIRLQPWGRDVMMVALTGWGQQEDRNRSAEAGFDSHMVKPVDHDALLRLLAAAVSR